MAEYDRSIATVLRLIQKKGEKVIWRHNTETVVEADKPWLPESDVQIDNFPFICFLPFDRVGKEFFIGLGGSEAASGSFYGLMGAVPFKPDLTDTVIRGNGTELEIESIDLLSPNGQIVLYTITFNG